MQINGVPISPMRLIRLISRIRPIVEKIQKANPDLTPSYFEILVAASFLYFAQEKVDWAVVEVGLGGRLDATNVLMPEISVITNVGLDHTEILGKTIEKIAYEKAGIIKRVKELKSERVKELEKNKLGVPVVTAATGKALKVIEKVTKEKKAALIKVDTRLGVEPLKSVAKDYLIIYKDIERYVGKSFAYSNFLLAITTVLALGFRPSKKAVLQISRLVFPGRFEKIQDNVIIDGAHNSDKMRYLIKTIKDSSLITRHSSLTLVVGFKKGKDWKKMIDILVKNLPIKKVIATEYQMVTDTGRGSAVAAKEIAEYLTNDKRLMTKAIKNSQEAVFNAVNLTSNKLITNQLILVTGSLYLIGEVRTLWFMPEF